jgi:guanylate kinase
MGEAVRPPAAPSRAAPRGRLLVLSGPSGDGKTVVAPPPPIRVGAVTATTRPPRPGEQDGVDYHFLSVEEFRRRLAAGWFLEHAEVYSRLYGTRWPRSRTSAPRAGTAS